MLRTDDHTSQAIAKGKPRSNLEKELRNCSLELLRHRELIESLPTFAPLTIAATPLFELALEVACQVAHNRAKYMTNPTRRARACASERWFEAISRLSNVCLNLPERRCTDFLKFWFEQAESGLSSPDIAPVEFSAGHEDAETQELPDCLLDGAPDAPTARDLSQPEYVRKEPADIGGDMNITPEFVHITNQVFDDTETFIARFAAQLQSSGRELIELLRQMDMHLGDGRCVTR